VVFYFVVHSDRRNRVFEIKGYSLSRNLVLNKSKSIYIYREDSLFWRYL
jgi:hypothetical protein